MTESERDKPTEPSGILAGEEDDSVIDLVEEIEEDGSVDLLTQLDRQLLGIGATPHADEPPANRLSDLGQLDFEEDDDQPESASLPEERGPAIADGAAVNAGMDWLFDPAAGGPPEERDQPPTEAETGFLPEAEPVFELMGSSPASADLRDADDDIELIDIEETEPDAELEWLDDLKLDQLSSFSKAPEEAAASEAMPSDAGIGEFPETSAADVFAANIAFGGLAQPGDPDHFPPPQAVIPTYDHLAAPPTVTPVPPSSETTSAVDAAALSNEQIEAAVERLIERRLGASLESIVRRAVETAVTKEIKRLQQLLLDLDLDDTAS